MEDVAIQHFRAVGGDGPDQVVHAFDPLKVHGQAFEAIRDFTGGRRAIDTADLLEVGELGHFHSV